MRPHKHAEVLRAIADGEKVEYFNSPNNCWQEMDSITPLNYPELSWRIKPEPPIVAEEHVYFSDLHGYSVFNKQFPTNIRFTFDPKTKNPIKVELI